MDAQHAATDTYHEEILPTPSIAQIKRRNPYWLKSRNSSIPVVHELQRAIRPNISRKYTLNLIARCAHVDRNVVERLVTGTSVPTIEKADAIAKLFGYRLGLIPIGVIMQSPDRYARISQIHA